MNTDPNFGVDGYRPQRLTVVTTAPIRYGDRVTSLCQTGTSALPSLAAMDGQHEPTPAAFNPSLRHRGFVCANHPRSPRGPVPPHAASGGHHKQGDRWCLTTRLSR